MSTTVITGVPRAGKTTLARQTFKNEHIFHTDELIVDPELPWSKRSEKIAHILYLNETALCVEGCDAIRGVRKFLRLYPGMKPCDRLIWLGAPRIALDKHQAIFAKGCKTVFDEILPELYRLEVQVDIHA